jgi:hypothetical protein
VVDATGTTVDNEAELMAASARLSWPPARGYLAVSVQDLMATDRSASLRRIKRPRGGSGVAGLHCRARVRSAFRGGREQNAPTEHRASASRCEPRSAARRLPRGSPSPTRGGVVAKLAVVLCASQLAYGDTRHFERRQAG